MTVIDTPEGTIQAYDAKIAAQVAESIQQQGPRIREALSMSGGAPPVEVEVWRFRHPHSQAEAYATSTRIVIRRLEEDWSRTLAHELVHWHAVGYWKTLPPVVEEGLAHLMSFALNDVTGVEFEPSIRELIDMALSMDSREHLSRPFDEALARINDTGMWIVAVLGMDQLRALAQRADEQGLSTIPAPWILAHLPATGTGFEFDPRLLFPDDGRQG